jgi:hypothetical protein
MLAVVFQIAALLLGSASAQDAQPRRMIHPLTDMPSAATDVSTSYYFPSGSELSMPIGKTVTVLCHFHNEGDFPYNVTAIMGSLNSPFDFNYHIQNYSYKPIGVVVRSGEEVTLEYQFQLHPDLQPVQYVLAHTVFYEDDSLSYSSTFFNQVGLFVFSQYLLSHLKFSCLLNRLLS